MASTYTGQAAGSLKIQRYQNFRGVDFTDEAVSEYRSPDALNMWKDYKTLGKKIETRPDIELQLSFSNTIYGLFFYTISQVDHWIIHCGTSLYDYNPLTKVKTVLKDAGMNPRKSVAFIYNNIFFIKDGINYLEYDGVTIKDVVGTIPTVSVHNYNTGKTEQYQDINYLSDYRREIFFGNGEEKIYTLNAKEVSEVKVYIDDVLTTTGYTVDTTAGTITFDTAPEKDIDSANVSILYKKAISGNTSIINKCTLATIFDNRVFFAGNQDYPNVVYWCALNDPRYVGDMSYANDGTDISMVKALVPGNNSLWVFKEPSQNNTTVFYHTPVIQFDERLQDNVKVYPESHSTISTGCTATGINFNDDICFFSDRGMEGITGDITKEQMLSHRSTLIDRKLLIEENYSDMTLTEWEGYLLTIIDNHIYLADSQNKATNNDHIEYEWFYWGFDKQFKNATVHKNILYLCSKAENIKDDNGYLKYTDGTNIYWYDIDNNKLYDNTYNESNIEVSTLTELMESGIYTLTNKNEDRKINSYWTTKLDDYDYTQMLKTTNKRGFKSDVSGESIKIEVRTDNNGFEEIGNYENSKGYIVAKLKRKKWNKIQLKYSSEKPFGIYSISLEVYIGSYVKRS